jgi:phenylalanyl-tRNA synthetase beta chain
LALALRTDSSSRFEKGISPHTTTIALERACQLLTELGAGSPVPGLIDISVPQKQPVKVEFTQAQIERHLGVEIPDMTGLLKSLGFEIEGGAERDSRQFATVPAWRRDVTIWQDLAEEAARLFGYDNIPTTMPASKNHGWLTKEQALRAKLHELCVSLGFFEALTYSFVGPADFEAARMTREGVKAIGNPLGEEHSMMRTALLPSFLKALSYNVSVRNPEVLLYELSRVYTDTGGQLPVESFRLILGGYSEGMDFFSLKGVIETLIERFCRMEAVYAKAENPAAHPGRCASVSLDGRGLGVVGELHPSLGFPAGAAFCELDVEALLEFARPDGVFSPLPRFPAITRDLALTCPKGTAAADVLGVIRKAGGTLLEDCVLFDVYAAKNSLAYRLSFRAPDRTLTDEEADGAIKKVLKKLQDGLSVSIRS